MEKRKTSLQNSSAKLINTRPSSITPKEATGSMDTKYLIESRSSSRRFMYVMVIASVFCLLVAFCLPLLLFFLLTPEQYMERTYLAKQQYSNHCTGISPYTQWINDTSTTMTMFINTSSCYFTQTPLYFSTIIGYSTHFCLTGYGVIQTPTPNSFQVYASALCNFSSNTNMLSLAHSYHWDVHWIGYYFLDFS